MARPTGGTTTTTSLVEPEDTGNHIEPFWVLPRPTAVNWAEVILVAMLSRLWLGGV